MAAPLTCSCDMTGCYETPVSHRCDDHVIAGMPPPDQYLAGLNRALGIVEAEIELPGAMPDELWARIANDRVAAEQAFRVAVRLAKDNIRDRIRTEIESLEGPLASPPPRDTLPGR